MPAFWSDVAKACTRQAVDSADFNATSLPKLETVIDATEPECAAIYIITTLRNFVHDTEFAKDDRWSAVARGAVAKDFESDYSRVVAKRKNRRHYGTSTNASFIKGVHQEKDSYNCKFTGEKRARHKMNWLLKMGQDLPTPEPAHAEIALHLDFWPNFIRETILELEAPNRSRAPKRSVDMRVFRVVTVVVDLGEASEGEFKTKFSPDGQMYYQLSYNIQVPVQSSLEIYLPVKGKRYGDKLTAAFEWTVGALAQDVGLKGSSGLRMGAGK
ncbi:hsp70 family chaperone [Stagonosporopsis vannaccii]|nr:hsp70 family chaperone [Stagonosporopsis vannaccii]